MRLALAITALLCCSACRTTATLTSSSAPGARVALHERTWEVRSGGEPLGLVVQFQERGRTCDSLYVVRNPWHQDLGMIDGLGRAYRYLPHREEPVWVGSGTIAAGARAILGAQEECELIELPTAAQASANEPQEPVARPADAPPSEGGLPQSR